jgi:hypothetical protein
MRLDPAKPWYHGSPQRLTSLRVGSTVTQDRELARIFSHKPAVVIGNDGKWKHTGPFTQGFIYRLVEQVTEADIVSVPNSSLFSGQEWNTKHAFSLELIAKTSVVPEELITKHELRQLAEQGIIDQKVIDTILKKQKLPE